MPSHNYGNGFLNGLNATFRRGVRWSLAGVLGSAVFQFLQMVVFARFATPAEAGDYALAAAMIGFLTPVAEAGVTQVIVYSRDIKPEQINALLWVNFAIGVLIFILLYIAGTSVAAWYDRPVLDELLCIMGASLLIAPLGARNTGLLSREMQFDKVAQIEVFSWALSSITIAVLAWQGWGARAMGAGFLGRHILVAAGSFLATRRQYPVRLFQFGTWSATGPLLKFGFFDLSSRWADFLANHLDKLIVGKWLGATLLGYYNLAFTFLILPTARLGYVIARVSFPVFARVRCDAGLLQEHFQKASRHALVMLLPVYAGIALFPEEIVRVIFGNTWLPAAPLLVAFGLAGWVRSCCVALPQLARGVGKPQLLFFWMLAWTLALNIFLMLFLSAWPSAGSAAWSRTAAKFTIELFLLNWLAKQCGVRFDPVWRFAGEMLIVLSPVLLLTWLTGQMPGTFWPVFVLKTIVFGAGLWWVAFKSPLRETVSEVLTLFGFERKP